MNKRQSIGLCSLLLTSVIANANVSGTVYQDLPLNGKSSNTYGQKDANEKGIAGITVTAYPSKKSTITDQNGSWSLESNGKIRVEFTNIPDYLKESAGESSVQFIDGDHTDVNLALFNPSQYATGETDIAMTLQPSAKLDASGVVALKVLKKDNISSETDNNSVAPTYNDIPFNKLGSVWGLAYDNSSETLYSSALVRRHIAMGAGGPGAIYKINENNVELFTTIDNVGTIPSNNERNLATNPNDPDHDPIFNEVGRVGLGDIDISEDGTKLYTINLHTNELVMIDIKTKKTTTYGIGNPFPNCPASDVASWGIGQNNGKVYVGSVCTTDVKEGAFISELNGDTFKPFHQIPLNMKGESSINSGTPLPNNARWRTWITNPTDLFNAKRVSYPAPILSDIVFDENNGMILGFTDRTAMQAGNQNFSTDKNSIEKYKYDAGGDIYRVCKVDNRYINEGEPNCSQNDIDAQTPNYPEFFTEEQWHNDIHKETALGGLAYLQGSYNVLSSSFDPVTTGNDYTETKEVDSSGIIGLNTQTGKKTMGQRVVGEYKDRVYNGKAGGIGDIELLTPIAPTEIGNRVWFDENANCIQDANESGIAGVTISLYNSLDCTGVAEETNTTDENGNYLFLVNPNTAYSVCIDDIENQTVLSDKKVTCNSSGTSIHNNDAIVSGSDAKISVSPLTTGANNHSFDFGFTQKESEVVTPTEPVVTDNNRTINQADDSCDCNSYKEDSTPALSIWSMMILVSLTSMMAFLFRKEVE
jgi:hypothetical protein